MAQGLVEVLGRGHHADGGEGTVLSKLASGELVKVTPYENGWSSAVNGSATVSSSGLGGSSAEVNQAGIPYSVALTVPSGFGNSAYMRFLFYGRQIGVRFRRDSLQPAMPVGFAVDGRVHPFGHDARPRFLNGSVASQVDGESHVLVADDLPDTPDGRPHTLEVHMGPDNVGSTTYTSRLFGFLCERRAGYTEVPRAGWPINAATAVPTSLTAIPLVQSGGTTDKALRFVRKVIYSNTSGGALTITVQFSGATVWAKSLAAGDSTELDYGLGTVLAGGNWKHIAGGAGINYTVIGGW